MIGFDSRDWDGAFPAGHDKYKFFFGKITEGDYLPSMGRFERQLFACRTLGLPISGWHFHRGYASAKEQSDIFEEWATNYGLPEIFPLILDLEDTWSTPSLRLVNNMWETLKYIEDWAGEVWVYTAKWYWDRIEPYIQGHHDFYSHALWESDPDPDTPEPGEWTKEDIVCIQKRLDFKPIGFNAKIDEDEMPDEIFNQYAGGGHNLIEIQLEVPQNADIIHLTRV